MIRWRHRGRPAMEDFLADPGLPVRGRQALTVCTINGCRYGNFGKGLCAKHYERWRRAGQPGLDGWDAPDLVHPTAPAECRLLLDDGADGLTSQSHAQAIDERPSHP